MKTTKKIFSAFIFWGLISALPAEELFVSTAGEFRGKPAFRSIGEGVASMKAGDTLIIAPGEYQENVVIRPFPGDPKKKTRIRALRPGSVRLCGGDGMFLFRILPGSSFTHLARVQQEVTGVCELDTFTHLQKVDKPELLETHRGSYCYIPEIKRLLISSSDGNAAKHHKYCVAFRPAPGISIEGTPENPVKNLAISGIIVTGFHAPDSSAVGVRARYAENLAVGFCPVFDNDGGFDFEHCEKSRIVSCDAYGNRAFNFRFSSGQDNLMRQCKSFYSAVGIIPGDVQMEDCISFYNDNDLAGETEKAVAADRFFARFPKETLLQNCVDPEEMDFRLQENGVLDIPGVQKAENVYFISSDGNDETNSGKSVASPWKTLKNVPEKSTVYLLPGIYSGDIVINQPYVKLKTRGCGIPAQIVGGKNGITINAVGVEIDRLAFREQTGNAISIEASDARISRCAFAQLPVGILAFRKSSLTFCHNSFDKTVKQPLRCYDCSGIYHSNIFATQVNSGSGLYSNHNSFFVNNIPVGEKYTVRRVPGFVDAEKNDFFQKKANQYIGRGLTGLPIGIYLLNGDPPSHIFNVSREKSEEGEILAWQSGRADDISTFRYAKNDDDAQWIELPVAVDGINRRVTLKNIPEGIWRFELTSKPAEKFRFIPYCGPLQENPRLEGRFSVR